MDKLTFIDKQPGNTCGGLFNLLNSSEPIVLYKGLYFPLKMVFPYVSRVNWDMGYIVTSGRIMPSKEASDFIKRYTWFPESCLLAILN
jgi:hypothetical protein